MSHPKIFIVSSIAVVLMSIAVPAQASMHNDEFNVPCSTLWLAVRDTLRNSGKYIILSSDSEDLTASYSIGGGAFSAQRTNSAH